MERLIFRDESTISFNDRLQNFLYETVYPECQYLELSFKNKFLKLSIFFVDTECFRKIGIVL